MKPDDKNFFAWMICTAFWGFCLVLALDYGQEMATEDIAVQCKERGQFEYLQSNIKCGKGIWK